METSGQAPGGARLEPITVAKARGEPTAGRRADSRACAEGPTLRSGFLKGSWLRGSGHVCA